ncbi:MAG: DUF3520 domain-containing protein, partial [Pseudomonadota bacterium]|nr:DUF3520 domain-containing protein [Pseudomonadota bacterium]
ALKGRGGERMDPLRYATEAPIATGADELAFVRVRYKRPADGMQATSRLIEQAVRASAVRDDAGAASPQFRLAAGVAAWGQLLRGGTHTGNFDFDDVLALAGSTDSADPEAGNFLSLVRLAQGLSTGSAQSALGRDAIDEE